MRWRPMRRIARLPRLKYSARSWCLPQNIDGLHGKAGSSDVIEIHGTLEAYSCSQCGAEQTPASNGDSALPRCEHCGGVVRPNVVLFGESLPYRATDRLYRALDEGFDMVFVIGTTAVFSLYFRTGRHGDSRGRADGRDQPGADAPEFARRFLRAARGGGGNDGNLCVLVLACSESDSIRRRRNGSARVAGLAARCGRAVRTCDSLIVCSAMLDLTWATPGRRNTRFIMSSEKGVQVGGNDTKQVVGVSASPRNTPSLRVGRRRRIRRPSDWALP